MEEKLEKCRYIHRFMGKKHNENHCVVDGWEDENVHIVSEEDCRRCTKYKSRFIEYPVTVNGINKSFHKYWENNEECGTLVKIRPCNEEYGSRTYLGILLGHLPVGISVTHNERTCELTAATFSNPAIFVPELKKIIFGMESWWGKIEDPEEIKVITDEEIHNLWYVKRMKELCDRCDSEKGE